MNLQQEELKTLIISKVKETMDKWKQPCGKITIQFICDATYKPKIELINALGNWYLKEINIGNKEIALKILSLNLHYNYFTLIDENHKTTDVKCHGHGEFWAEEYHNFIFYRIPEKEDEKN